MARYYRRRRYRPRRYVRRWFRRRIRRFVNGSSKSTVRVKIPLSFTFQVANVDSSGVVSGHSFIPFATTSQISSALNSPLYRLYTQLYDEVKCIGTKIVLSVGTPIGTSSVPSATFVTAWDRRRASNLTSDAAPTFAQLLEYSSARKAVAVNNSIAKMQRSCYASDLLEKAQWHDCSLGTVTGYYRDEAYSSANANVNFFCPCMYLGISQTGSTAQNIDMQADVTYYFAFRNPKYGGTSGSSSKGVDIRSLPVVADMEHEDLYDDGEMDAEQGDIDTQPILHKGGGAMPKPDRTSVTDTLATTSRKRKNVS